MQQQLRGSEGRRGLAAYEARHRVDQRIVEPRGARVSTSGASSSSGRRASAPALKGGYWVSERAQQRGQVQTLAASVGYGDVSAHLENCHEEFAANLIRNKAHTNL